jgi:hypothetical protein
MNHENGGDSSGARAHRASEVGWIGSLARDWREIAPALRSLFTARRHMPRHIAEPADLPQALSREAAFLAQSSVYAYCRARTGFMGPKLFDEPAFLGSIEICRWQAYVACLSDLFVLIEGRLRGAYPGRQETLADQLTALFATALQAQEEHPPEPRDWDADVAEFRSRLARLQLAAPLPIVILVEYSAQAIYDHLPFHEKLLRPDEEMVFNSVRFRFLRCAEDLDRKIDFAAMARLLAADTAAD